MKAAVITLSFCTILLLAFKFCNGQGQRSIPQFPFIPNLLQGIVRNPNACLFGGPQDRPILQGENFIENLGANKCLTRKPNGSNNGIGQPLELEGCTWDRIPSSTQLYKVQNGNGGTVLKPTVSGSFGRQVCLSTNGFGNRLAGVECSPSGKDFSQTWRFTRVRTNVYQISQMSSGMCLRADSTQYGIFSTLERCNSWDNYQLWRICTSK